MNSDLRVKSVVPEWQIILNQLIYQDQFILFRICRKMIIYLLRINIPEISRLLVELNPEDFQSRASQTSASNWPGSKGTPFHPNKIILDVFNIASKYLSEEMINYLLGQWMHQEHMNSYARILEQRNVPLSQLSEATKNLLRIIKIKQVQTKDEIIGYRVALIYRLLSENLNFINIAKNYLTVSVMSSIIDRVFGPEQGLGKLGGKSAGLILANQIIIEKKKTNELLANVVVPKSRYITSDGSYSFLYYNALDEFFFNKYKSHEDIKQEYPFLVYIFKNSKFSQDFLNSLSNILDDMGDMPIIVRSSSLLEDSFEGAFSGKYKSLFLSNIGKKEVRLKALINAVAEIYASIFAPDPIEYRKERGLLDFREEMGILIQQVVGKRVGKYYLPSFAGVAFSNNEMRWSTRIEREDGVVRLVAGLGTRAVDRTINDYPKLISPGKPSIRVNNTDEETIRYSQQFVDVINLESNQFETIKFTDLIRECNGNYPGIENIVSFNRGGNLVNPISAMMDFTSEDLVITFNGLIEKTSFVKQLKCILDELSQAYNGPVDIEFASDGELLYLLQCRPQSRIGVKQSVKVPVNIDDASKIFSASQYVSNGIIRNIKFIVYIDFIGYAKLQKAEEMFEIGKIVSRLNQILPRKEFLLIGPGRWGSKGDIKLGVPVIYSDINNTAMLIEVAREQEGYVPELSFGTHFFQDLVESDIKYLPLYPDKSDNIFNEAFFRDSKNQLCDFIPDCNEYNSVIKLIQLDKLGAGLSLSVYMDGESNYALGFLVK